MKKILGVLIMTVLLVAIASYLSTADKTPATLSRCVIEQTTVVRLDQNRQSKIMDTVEAAPDSPVLLPIFSAVPGWYKVTTAAFVDGWIPAGECKRVR